MRHIKKENITHDQEINTNTGASDNVISRADSQTNISMFKNLENTMSRIGEQKGNFNRETENLKINCMGNVKEIWKKEKWHKLRQMTQTEEEDWKKNWTNYQWFIQQYHAV